MLNMVLLTEEMNGWILSGKKEAKENISEASPRRVVDGAAAEDVVGRVSRVLSL
jgi:hypothetical protein